jgi:hypothetical protein
MSTFLLAAYLLLVGITIIFHAAIPGWVAGVLAIAAGLLLLIEKYPRKP